MSDTPGIRLDKWLWAARFYKTRALAKSAIENGKVHYNRARPKPSRTVEVGAVVRLQVGWDEKTVDILGLSNQRLSAPEAQKLYQETDESIAKREEAAQKRKLLNLGMPESDRRPNKKDRRHIIRFKSNYHDVQ